MDFTVRELAENEYGLLEDFLYEAIFVPEGMLPPDRSVLSLPELQVYIADFGKREYDAAFLAEADGRAAGAVWCRVMNDYGHIDDATPSVAVAVYKEFRGIGIGTALLNRLSEHMKGMKCAALSLSVQKSNPALRLYLRIGFETVRESGEEFVMRKYL